MNDKCLKLPQICSKVLSETFNSRLDFIKFVVTIWSNNEENIATGQMYNARNSAKGLIFKMTMTQSLGDNIANKIETVSNATAVNTVTNFTNFAPLLHVKNLI